MSSARPNRSAIRRGAGNQDAVQAGRAGQAAEDGEDGAGVPARDRGGGTRAGGQVLDEAPAGEWLKVGMWLVKMGRPRRGGRGGEVDAFVAGELTWVAVASWVWCTRRVPAR